MLYRNFSNQDEIDREYNPRLRVEQTDQYLTKYLSESERVSKTLNYQDGIQYGPTLNEILDYYPSSDAQAPLLCFIAFLLILAKMSLAKDQNYYSEIVSQLSQEKEG